MDTLSNCRSLWHTCPFEVQLLKTPWQNEYNSSCFCQVSRMCVLYSVSAISLLTKCFGKANVTLKKGVLEAAWRKRVQYRHWFIFVQSTKKRELHVQRRKGWHWNSVIICHLVYMCWKREKDIRIDRDDTK